MDTILDKTHAVAIKLGYKQLAVVLGITPMGAWKKIKYKSYTIGDADKLFTGTIILSRL